jgi:hypothetical protein
MPNLSNDSLKAMFKKSRALDKSLTIDMYYWESVKNKVTNEEYITIWYKQKWEDMKWGKKIQFL